MQRKEVRKLGLQILKDVFPVVLESNDKELWKEAIASIHRHIFRLEREVREAAVHNDERANAVVVNLWAWNSARRQLYARFGHRFIRSQTSHAKAAEESL